MEQFGDVHLCLAEHVAIAEIRRPPYNFFDQHLIKDLADAFEYFDSVAQCRAIVLASQGKAFCAGADFQSDAGTALFGDDPNGGAATLYQHAVRLFRTRKPVVAAVQGAAIGGGLGLALVADFRVICESTRFSANFVKLGVHAGFGISHVLPRIVGRQRASLMLYTGRRVGAAEAMAMGLGDLLATPDDIREQAIALAAEIAQAAPLAVESTRMTLRAGLAEAVERQVQHEFAEQSRLARTQDHVEGVRAVTERRAGRFIRA